MSVGYSSSYTRIDRLLVLVSTCTVTATYSGIEFPKPTELPGKTPRPKVLLFPPNLPYLHLPTPTRAHVQRQTRASKRREIEARGAGHPRLPSAYPIEAKDTDGSGRSYDPYVELNINRILGAVSSQSLSPSRTRTRTSSGGDVDVDQKPHAGTFALRSSLSLSSRVLRPCRRRCRGVYGARACAGRAGPDTLEAFSRGRAWRGPRTVGITRWHTNRALSHLQIRLSRDSGACDSSSMRTKLKRSDADDLQRPRAARGLGLRRIRIIDCGRGEWPTQDRRTSI
ncbi:hypothetical protein C2E23DRAFT_551112 [Lenzites betulinus]|nr:hypothetical protein C2E23DRAFT_551112 [Lenzites betulinus]